MSTWKAAIAKMDGDAVAENIHRIAVAEPVVITAYERTQKLPQLEEFSLEILTEDEVGVDPYNRTGNLG